KAEWGSTQENWKPITVDSAWLQTQMVFCLTSPAGALDVFRDVKGLEGCYNECKRRAVPKKTGTGIGYPSLSDEDMLRCQEVLEPAEQHHERIRLLKEAIAKQRGVP